MNRQRLRELLETGTTQRVITGLILINAVLLGMETSPALVAKFGHIIGGLDSVILVIFVIEIGARMGANVIATASSAEKQYGQ